MDTNVISETRKQRPHGAVVAWISSLDQGRLFIPAPVFGELQFGVARTKQTDPAKASEIEYWIDEIAAVSNVLPAGPEEFRRQAQFMQGRDQAAFVDALIAAIAFCNNLVVATRNIRDFHDFDVGVFNPFEYRG